MNRGMRIALGLVLLTAAIFLVARFFLKDERKVITARLHRVAELVSAPATGKPLTDLGSASDLSACFANPVQFRVEGPPQSIEGEKSRSELREMILGARALGRQVAVELVDVNVTLGEDDTATAHFTLKARQGSDLFVQEMKTGLRKIDGDWLIERVETIRTLR